MGRRESAKGGTGHVFVDPAGIRVMGWPGQELEGKTGVTIPSPHPSPSLFFISSPSLSAAPSGFLQWHGIVCLAESRDPRGLAPDPVVRSHPTPVLTCRRCRRRGLPDSVSLQPGLRTRGGRPREGKITPLGSLCAGLPEAGDQVLPRKPNEQPAPTSISTNGDPTYVLLGCHPLLPPKT